MSTTHKSQPKGLHIHFDTNFTQLVIIVLMFLALFVLPIELSAYLSQQQKAAQETYTSKALAETQGKVAGLSTQAVGESRYYLVPVINFKFDTNLSEPATISFVFGGMLLLIGGTITLILLWDNQRQKT